MPTISTIKKLPFHLFLFLLVPWGLSASICLDTDDLHWENDQQRYPLTLNAAETVLRLCELDPGQTYTIWLSSPLPELTERLALMSKGLEQEIPHFLQFRATDICQELRITVDGFNEKTAYPIDLTIVRESIRNSTLDKMRMMGINTDPSFSAETLIEDIFIGGGCFDVANVMPIGNQQGIGFFNNGTSSIGIEEGVILATGATANAHGPNTATNITTNFFDNSGDPDLNILASGANVFDAVGIEFDFTPTLDMVEFNYVFASDEYCDYVNTQFNDVFGFFISGPGITGGFTGGADNIALVPGTNLDVSINNVNIQNNAVYYVDNVPLGQNQQGPFACTQDLAQQGLAINDCEYDGFTTVLTATANVIPCETYRIRLVVGDVGDGIFDSAVFLEANSFSAGGEVALSVDIPSIEATGIAYEGCSDGFIIFERPDDDLSLPLTVNFQISPASTATNGTDYSNIPPSITIPAGQTQFLLPLEIYQDFISEGTELIILELENPCSCDDAFVNIQIQDVPPLSVALPDQFLCDPGLVTLDAAVAGGVPGYTYEWYNSSPLPSISVFPDVGINTYTVTVSDNCGNVEVATATIEVGETSIASIDGLVEVCDANPQGVFPVYFTGNGPWELTYAINGIPQPTITGITENPYLITTTDLGTYTILSITSNGCPGIPDGAGLVLPVNIFLLTQTDDISCGNEYNGSVDLLVTGGTPEYGYEWSNGFFEEDIDQLGPGEYFVTVTDLNGCTAVTSAEITAPDSIVAEALELQGVDCNDPNGGAVDLTVTGGSPTYTYLWSNGSELEDPTDLPAGVSTVAITDADGCTTEAEVIISQDTLAPEPDATPDGILNCENLAVLLDASGSGGSNDLSFAWTDGTGTNLGADAELEVETPGTYTLVVTNNDNGCTAELPVIVEQNITPPDPDILADGTLDCTTTSILLDGNGSAGEGTLSYSWLDDSQTEVSIDPTYETNEPGDFTLVITDAANGCTAETSVNIAENTTPPTAVIDPADVLDCEVTDLDLNGENSSGQGTLSFEWSDESGGDLGGNTNLNIDAPGTYTLVVTDAANGCTATTDISVTQDIEAPIPEASPEGILDCDDLSVVIDGSASTGNGSLSYAWTNSGGGSLGSLPELTVEDAGTYTLVITDGSNGCTASIDAEVLEDVEAPQPDVAVDDVLDCIISTVQLSGTELSGDGEFTFSWLDADGNALGNATSLEVDMPGIYELVITNTDNACTAVAPIEVEQDITPPLADAGDDDILNCDVTEVELNGSGSSNGTGITYQWFNEGGIDVGQTQNVAVSEAGDYTLLVTNTLNGCTAEANVNVAADSNLPDAVAAVDDILNCTTTETMLDGSGSSANGSITYQWLNENDVEIGTQPSVEVGDPGVYVLVISDLDNGCTAQTTVEVMENVIDPNAVIADPNTLTCAVTTIALNGSASSANGSIQFNWEDVDGTDLGNSTNINVTTPGDYVLVVTDLDNGCTASTMVQVDQNIQEPQPVPENSDILTCVTTIVTLDGANSQGIGMLEYEWLNETNTTISNMPTAEVNGPGTYTLVVTDMTNGCSAEMPITVEQDITDPTPAANVDGILNCADGEALLSSDGSTGAHALNYQWLDEMGNELAITPDISTTEAGTYTLIITDQVNGCTADAAVIVLDDFEAPTPAADVSNILTCELTTVALNGNSSVGNGALEFQWLDENNLPLGDTALIDVNEIGTYTLQITDTSNGCTATTEVQVNQDIEPPMADAGPGQTLTCDITTVVLDGNGSSNGAIYSYEWINAGGVSVSNELTAEVGEIGSYDLIVTNIENGCTALANVDVIPDANLPIADAGQGGLLTCAVLEISLDGSNSSIGGAINYEWFDPNGNSLGDDIGQMVNIPGTYTLMVTDNANGCSSTASVEVEQNIDTPTPDPGQSPTLTCEITTVTLDGGNSTSPLGDLTYAWFDTDENLLGENTLQDISTAGWYTLQVTAENGCTASAQVEVLLDAAVPVADAGPDGILNCDISVLNLGGPMTSTGPDIAYQWFNAEGELVGENIDLDVEIPGVYTLQVLNSSNNCLTEAQVVVDENILVPLADAGPEATLTCELTSFILGSSVNPDSDLNYQWFNENSELVGEALQTEVEAPGIYTLQVLNPENGCESAAQVEIEQDIVNPAALAGDDGILTCEITEYLLDGSNSTGNNLTYAWYNEGGAVISDLPQVEVAETGQFTLIVTNTFNGCTDSDDLQVIPDANLPTASASNDGILTCEVGTVMLDGSASNSVSGSLSFAWSDSNNLPLGSTPTISVASPGLYTLTITDTDNGCTTSTQVEVPQDIASPLVDAGPNDTLTCSITELLLSGSASNGTNWQYLWQDADNQSIANTAAVNVDMPGVYTFIVTNIDNGCVNAAQVEIIPDLDLPVAAAGPDETLTCVVEAVTLNGSATGQNADLSYHWENSNGVTVSEELNLEVDQPGQYTLIVVDNVNSCVHTDMVNVDQNITPPTPQIDGDNLMLNCDIEVALLDGSSSTPNGQVIYDWSTNNGSIITALDQPGISVNAPGIYQLEVTSLLNGCTELTQIQVNQDINPPAAIIGNPAIITCNQSEVNLNAINTSTSGTNFAYLWLGSGTITNPNSLNPTVNTAGTYTLLVENLDNGCTFDTNIDVSADLDYPDAQANGDDELDCVTEEVQINGFGSSEGGAFFYQWLGAGLVQGQNNLLATVDAPGLYTLVVTNLDNGCASESQVQVLENTNVPTGLDASIVPPPCVGDDGAIEVVAVSGGEGPYVYSIDGGESYYDITYFNGLVPGNYDIMVQDAIGCEYGEQLFIPNAEPIDVITAVDLEVQLGDSMQLEAFVNIPIWQLDTLYWTPAATLSCANCPDPYAQPLNTTVYTVTVVNQNGCLDSDQIELRVIKDRGLFIPNAFTPHNNDGENDVFMIFSDGRGVKNISNFQIFDRWGELVFQDQNFLPDDPAHGWDGYLRGEPMNPAVFVYWAEVEYVDGEVILYKGDVTLLR